MDLSIFADQIVAFTKQEMLYSGILKRIAHQEIIEQICDEHKIEIALEEIQARADEIRRAKRLEKASQTIAWLEGNMITEDEWEASIKASLLREKLADHLFNKEAEKYFAEHRSNYELVSLYHIVVPYRQLAQEILYQVEEEETSFFQAAHLYDVEERRRNYCGYEGKLCRWDLKPEVAAMVFGSPVGCPVGSIEIEDLFHLFLVEEFIEAELTPSRKQKIIEKLFQEWLERELIHRFHDDV